MMFGAQTLLNSIHVVSMSASLSILRPAAAPLWNAAQTDSLVTDVALESLLSSTDDCVGYDLPDRHRFGIWRLSVRAGWWLLREKSPLKWLDWLWCSSATKRYEGICQLWPPSNREWHGPLTKCQQVFLLLFDEVMVANFWLLLKCYSDRLTWV